MDFCVRLLMLFVLAYRSIAFPFAKLVEVEDRRMHEKLMAGMSIPTRMIYEKALLFRPEQALNNPDLPDLAQSLGLTALVTLLLKADLVHCLSQPGPFTLFGPTNEAFTELPEWTEVILSNKTLLTNLLKFHILPTSFPSASLQDELLVSTALKGKKLRVNIYTDSSLDSVAVVTAQCAPIDLRRVDEAASNGLIHVIGAVMMPPIGNIIDNIATCPVFKTLVNALKAARLVKMLKCDGPFTLFAPTDKAFSKLPPDFLDKLMKNTTALRQVLKYHIVSLTYCSAGLATGLYGQITTLEKENVTIQVAQDEQKVNNARIIVPDGSVTNGVVHGIDTVLIPPGLK